MCMLKADNNTTNRHKFVNIKLLQLFNMMSFPSFTIVNVSETLKGEVST